MPAKISLTKLKGYEEITPPYTIRPTIVHLQYDSKQKYQFVIFDTETTCTGKLKSSLENQITVLIGHNSATCDVPILLRNSNKNFKDGITDMNVYFADSLHLMKNLI